MRYKIEISINEITLKIIFQVSKLDISRQLTEYAVEYSVLREEMPRLATLTEQNRHLQGDVNKMSAELDVSINTISGYDFVVIYINFKVELLDIVGKKVKISSTAG